MERSTVPKAASFRTTALRTMSIVVVPLFLAVMLFSVSSLRNQQEALRSARLNTLSAYQAQVQQSIQLAEFYLRNTTASNMDFQTMVYARTKAEAYAAAQTVAKNLRPLLQANTLISGFYTYSLAFDCYRPNNLTSFPLQDAQLIKDAIVASTQQGNTAIRWQSLTLSNRTVLLAITVFRENAAAAVLDPGGQPVSGLGSGELIFSITPEGTLYKPTGAFTRVELPANGADFPVSSDESGSRYDIVALPLADFVGYILYASPAFSLLEQLNLTQRVLLILMLLLLIAIPFYWLTFRRLLLEPLISLTAIMQSIQKGETALRVPQTSRLDEVNQIAWTVNTMLDTLQQQKITAYEQKLETQRAQLQYLQLQIRPHFYLNCLNVIFSLAEEKQYKAIQRVVLDLSAYLRGMFRDGSKSIPLSSELRSVESYIRIQQANTQQEINFSMDLDAVVVQALVPPLCVLTFVENAFKHNTQVKGVVKLQVKGSCLSSDEGDWLNLVITDNCGGLPLEKLQYLNHIADNLDLYRENRVGVVNIVHRLRLLYGDRAVVSFRNQGEGTCVDLFLPLAGQETEEEDIP